MRLFDRKNQYKKAALCFWACTALTLPLSGCSFQTGEMPEGTMETELSEENEAPEDGVIIWTMPEGYCDLNQYADKFNQKLAEDGYDFRVVFEYLPENGYHEAVGKRLAEGSTDIAFLGFRSEYDNAPAALIREGNLEELTSFLDSGEGAVLRDFYRDEIWDTVRVDGGIYSLPNQCAICGGDCFVFNRELFSEDDVADFDGGMETFGKLVEILDGGDFSQVQYPVICGRSLWSAAQMGGYEYRNGVFISLTTGEVFNPYETEALREFLYTMQSLYQNGYLGEDGAAYEMDFRKREQAVSERNFGVWISDTSSAAAQKMKGEMVCVEGPYSLVSTVSAGTGVSRYAPNKEAALTLLTLLYTNAEYGNLLLLGEEGVDYVLTDGYICALSGENKSVYVQELLTGLYDNIHPAVDDNLPVNRRQTRFEIYDSDVRMGSAILGFQENTEGIEDRLAAVCRAAEQYADIWKEEDLERAIEEAVEAYRAAGGDLVVEEMSRQIEEWRSGDGNR